MFASKSSVSRKALFNQSYRLYSTSSIDVSKASKTKLYTTPGDSIEFGKLINENKTVVIVGIPGAFTPVCSNSHIPAFIKKADELKKMGVDKLICMTVNDAFVAEGWRKSMENGEKIEIYADPDASFTKALGLDVDLTAHGLGVRSKRYSMLIKDGKAKYVNIENSPGDLEESLPEKIMEQLKQ